jgi:hypothetical protein
MQFAEVTLGVDDLHKCHHIVIRAHRGWDGQA